MNILFLRAGIFSNVNEHLYQALCRSHHVVKNIDSGQVIKRKALQFSSWYNIVHTILHSKRHWRQTHSKNTYAFSRMTQHCNRIVKSRTDYDLIFQTQCKFSITENPYSRPYFIYTDLTQKLTDRLWPKWALKGSSKEISAWYSLEKDAFQRVEKIFTFNNCTKASFVEDYHLDPDKVIVVGAGINADNVPDITVEKKYASGFKIFFLTTEFDRQGGTTVIKSYEIIKQNRPDIKLVIGGKCPRNLPRNIETLRTLSPETITNIFLETIIFLMPGRLGGLQSVLQAMNNRCLCIVGDSNILLTDVIEDHQTGIVVRADDPAQLADRILELYHHESLIIKIANQAHKFVRENCTWEFIVQKMNPYFKN